MLKNIIATLAALALIATPLAAQSSVGSADASALATVTQGVTAAAVADLDFGSRFQNSGVGPQVSKAQWEVSFPGAATLDLSFTLPTELSNGLGDVLPFACQSASAHHNINGGPMAVFDPNVGVAGFLNDDPAGQPTIRIVELGIGGPNGDCTIDVGGVATGSYTATITLTVSLS